MHTNQPGLGRGERAPDFVLPLQQGTQTRFYGLAGGKPTVLLFCGAVQAEMLQRFAATLSDAASQEPALVAIQRAQAEPQKPVDGSGATSFPVFLDAQGKVHGAYRLSEETKNVVYVLDANLRVLTSLYLNDAEADAKQVASFCDRQATYEIEPKEMSVQAPVLLIPNVLTAEMCLSLIDVWQKQGSEETGVEQSQEGRRQEAISEKHKQRRDHIVRDRELMQTLSITIGRRVMPEVMKAFAFRATRFEGFKIACYDAASGGFFHAHRDNLSPATAHRRFALTLNLNDEYEGGFLRFPEYGPHLYRPQPGEALVFSCSHLHEVTKITKGQRFTLLSFLFGEGDVRTRQTKQQKP